MHNPFWKTLPASFIAAAEHSWWVDLYSIVHVSVKFMALLLPILQSDPCALHSTIIVDLKKDCLRKCFKVPEQFPAACNVVSRISLFKPYSSHRLYDFSGYKISSFSMSLPEECIVFTRGKLSRIFGFLSFALAVNLSSFSLFLLFLSVSGVLITSGCFKKESKVLIPFIWCLVSNASIL